MASGDRTHWDDKYLSAAGQLGPPELPARFGGFSAEFAQADTALEIACGAGRTAVWLAERGVRVSGFDISPVAVAHATDLATARGVGDRCTFATADFDDGLPSGPQVDLVVCNLFRDERLDTAIIERLAPGGLLAIAALSEVGAAPGRFRVAPSELTRAFEAFDAIELLDHDEADGVAWLVARRRS